MRPAKFGVKPKAPTSGQCPSVKFTKQSLMSRRIQLFLKSSSLENSKQQNLSYNLTRIYKNDYINKAKVKLMKMRSRGRSRMFSPICSRPQTTTFSMWSKLDLTSSKKRIGEVSETEGVSTNCPEMPRIFSADGDYSKRK
mmetsp:Transcript_14452/g.16707  ORF Transcript_14452/g.16707 Transcript_14452/m.16707 type:complete len:140 (+) Transcript_14452:507-926(+)